MKDPLKIGMALCAIALSFWFFLLYEDVRPVYEKRIGRKVSLYGDTLTITDYSVWKETFTLSDGREVGARLVIIRVN